MSKVLVTGGAGYIGSHAVAKLVQQGFEVLVLDNLSTGDVSLLPGDVRLIQGDVRDLDLVKKCLRENEVGSVMHFAACTSVEESLKNPELYYSNNFEGTLCLLRACSECGTRNFIFSSTAAVYADPDNQLVSEESPVNPVTPYGASKLMSESALRDLAQASGLRYMILRYFNVAGASESNERGQIGDSHPALIKRTALAALGKIPEMKIYGTDYGTTDGTAVRDFIHVEDLADIHVLALQCLMSGAESQILNCGYGSGFSVREVIDVMKRVSGVDFKTVETSRRPGDLASVVADNRKLLNTLHWKPKRNNLDLICRTAFFWEKRVAIEKMLGKRL